MCRDVRVFFSLWLWTRLGARPTRAISSGHRRDTRRPPAVEISQMARPWWAGPELGQREACDADSSGDSGLGAGGAR